MHFRKFVSSLGLVLWAMAPHASADSLSWVYQGAQSTDQPGWIQSVAARPSSDETLGTLEFDITPPSEERELLVTLTFTEAEAGFLRLLWTQNGQAIALSENFQEGIGMTNRRSILIPKELLQGPGRLTIVSGTVDLKVTVIEWNWLIPRSIPVAEGPGGQWRLVDGAGRGRLLEQVSGEPEVPPADQWQNHVVTASLTDKPERIENPTEFSVPFTQIPAHVRLDAQLSGLPLGTPVRIWVNGKDAGLFSVSTPELTDPGYQRAPQGECSYVGWRPGSAWIDSALFSLGDNKIQFEPLWLSGNPSPLAIKNARLQADYGEEPATAPSAPSEPH